MHQDINNPTLSSVLESKDGIEKKYEQLLDIHQDLERLVAVRTQQLIDTTEELGHTQVHFQALLDHTPTLISITDLNSRYMMVNRKYEELLGSNIDEYIGKPPFEVWPEDIAHNILKNEKITLEKGNFEGEEVYRNKAGEERTYLSNKFLLNNKNNMPFAICTISTDISERLAEEQVRLNLEKQLQQAQKMEIIGQMTGGIAHDFNNILTTMLGYTELAQMVLEGDQHSKLNFYMQEIHRAGEKARDLVMQLLAIGRNKQNDYTRVSLADLINETVQLLSATIPSTIKIRHTIDANVPNILSNAVQLTQVLMNLSVNARDAIEGTGTININLSVSQPDEIRASHCKTCFRPIEGNWVKVTIQDNGEGIPKEIQSKIFDPFFTTKEVGKGSGMGLAMVQKLIHDQGGHIDLSSEPGEGTTFTLYFPMEGEQQADHHEAIKQKRTSAKILVVDDDVLVANYLSRLFQTEGYEVNLFTESTKALKAFEEAPEKYHLMVTDQNMPTMTGAELVEAVLRVVPKFPVIMCTGYSETVDEQLAKRMGISYYLAKPINSKQLLNNVKTILADSNLNE